ncbi:MAG: hypothetical protein H6680_00400 [Desulfobacteraceae bacterium]|nr:hypothetical protein [Desulfobacteraceae bacterium]
MLNVNRRLNTLIILSILIFSTNLLSGCGTSTRLIKKHVTISENIDGENHIKGSEYSESITQTSGPIITKPGYLLINLTVFPLITGTGPWSDTMNAKQKKVVMHYSSEGKLTKRSDVEVKLSLTLNSPMMIAHAVSYNEYLDDVFDFVWNRALSEMRAKEIIDKTNVIETTLPVFQTQRNFSINYSQNGNQKPDTDHNFLMIRDDLGRWNSKKDVKGEKMLSEFIRMFGIGEIRVQLWTESRTPEGELLVSQTRDYSIRPTSSTLEVNNLNIN